MATITAPRPELDERADDDDPGYAPRTPDWVRRIPTWLWVTGGLIALMALSAFFRTRYINSQYWMDEAITTGIALHPLDKIPHVLRYDGNPPLYYMLLHLWMKGFGDSVDATHSLSLLFGLLTIPAGGWGAWKLFGRRAGVMAAILFAFNAWLTSYAQETRMYELMGLWGVLATTFFVLAFVERRRRWLPAFGLVLLAMLYTHSWGTFFFVGSAISLIPSLLARTGRDRIQLLRDAVLTYLAAGILYLPWVADAAVPGRAHRGPVGHAAAVRRPGPDLAQRARRRQDHDRPRVRRGDRAGAPVHARAAAQPGGDQGLHAAAAADRGAGDRLGRVAGQPRLGAALLRAGDRLDAVPGRLGLLARPAARDRRGRALVRVPGQPVRGRAQAQVRHALRRGDDGSAAAPGRPGRRRPARADHRLPGTTSRPGCASPTPPAARSPTPPT